MQPLHSRTPCALEHLIQLHPPPQVWCKPPSAPKIPPKTEAIEAHTQHGHPRSAVSCLEVHRPRDQKMQEPFPFGSAELWRVLPSTHHGEVFGMCRQTHIFWCAAEQPPWPGRAETLVKPWGSAHTGGGFIIIVAVAKKAANFTIQMFGECQNKLLLLLLLLVFMVKSKASAVVSNLRASSLAKNAGCSLLYTSLTQMLWVSPTADSPCLQRVVFNDPSIRIKNELSFSCICFGKREII